MTSIIVSLILYYNLDTIEAQSGQLRVGAGKVCINPPDNMFLSGLEYFDFANRDFIGIHDSLFVRSIIIENGHQKAALISLDIAKVPGGNDLINAIASEMNIQPEYVFISATHDHNTIELKGNEYLSSPYYEIIRNAVIQSIKEASSKIQPAKVGYATGKAYVNTNRDEKIGEGYHMGYNPDGPSDKTVAVVSFKSLSGELLASYANYAVHGVVMYRARTRDGHPEVTGDLPGATSRYLEEHFKGAIALWTSGAAGDQNPLFMANYNQDAPDVYDLGKAGYALLEVQARRLGEEIVRLIENTRNTSSIVQIWSKKSSVICPGRQRKETVDLNLPRQGYLAPVKIEMIDGDSVIIPLHLLMINDIAFAGVSAEVFTKIGMNLKKESPFDCTFMVTLMPNDIGYIPTDESFLLPSEKAITNRFRPGYAESSLINAFIELMNDYLHLKTKVN